MKLIEVRKDWMLYSAIRSASLTHKRGLPLWSIVGRICSVGSTSAHEICREMGWDPEAKATSDITAPK